MHNDPIALPQANGDARTLQQPRLGRRTLGGAVPPTHPARRWFFLCSRQPCGGNERGRCDFEFAVRNVTEDLTPGSSTAAQATLAAATGLCAAHNSLPGARLFASHSFHGRRGFLGVGVASWTPDAGYEGGAGAGGGAEGAYPRRVRGPGEGLRRLLAVRFHGIGSACSHRRRSVQMRFHNPATVATPTQSSVPVVPGEATYLALTPQVVVTSTTLRRWYSPHQRQSLVQIYFPERYFFAYMRTEVFGFVELVANLGGLLGLCLGMSLVSVAELLFWLVQLVRYICPLRPFPRLGLRRMWGGACNSIFADCV
ncbi:Pickpocket protein 28 [Gryllus bimaculatus]|nr:Pickpocket protein 28 [Gryllus bimaculatus]